MIAPIIEYNCGNVGAVENTITLDKPWCRTNGIARLARVQALYLSIRYWCDETFHEIAKEFGDTSILHLSCSLQVPGHL